MISLIVAHDANLLIGKEGWMPWDLKEDLKHFRQYTLGKTVLMGRKTFDGIGKPLPKRLNLVLTSQDLTYDFENVEVIHHVDEIVERFGSCEEELVVCGGAQIYQLMLPYVKKMVISLVEGDFEGDTYFPSYDVSLFDIESEEQKEGFRIITYVRKEL